MEAFLARLEPVWHPHPGQREFLLNPARNKVLACGRRWGKTDACAVQILASLFRDHPARHLILAPTLDQARLLFDRTLDLIDELARHEQRIVDFKVRRTPYPHMRLGRHVVMARSGHIGRALRGNEATDIIVDEAAYVPEELVTEVAMPMLATTNGTLTMISTPRGKNHFWRFFKMGERREHGVWSRRAPSSESPYVSKNFLRVQRELISERAYSVEYEAQFLDSQGQVFASAAIENAVVAELPEIKSEQAYIGVDWARYADYTAVAVLRGTRSLCRLDGIWRFHGTTWSEAVRRVAEIIRPYESASVLCDATGIGDPVLEMLKSEHERSRIEGLVFTARSKNELIDNLAWLFDKGSIKMLPDTQLLKELEHFEARQGQSGHTKLGAGSGFHDDMVIALALAARQLPREYTPGIGMGSARKFSEDTLRNQE
ncbi:MAG: hypothetical protein IH944_01555 [Armatimonadetes bacterium]|nr:hypothetical protein [Armatimonadota bacterium]